MPLWWVASEGEILPMIPGTQQFWLLLFLQEWPGKGSCFVPWDFSETRRHRELAETMLSSDWAMLPPPSLTYNWLVGHTHFWSSSRVSCPMKPSSSISFLLSTSRRGHHFLWGSRAPYVLFDVSEYCLTSAIEMDTQGSVVMPGHELLEGTDHSFYLSPYLLARVDVVGAHTISRLVNEWPTSCDSTTSG